MSEFVEGDLIAVFGGEQDRDTLYTSEVTLCRVLIVGLVDLVVEWSTSYTNSYYVVPKSICLKLYCEPETVFKTRVLDPEIGDLIVSFSGGYKQEDIEKLTGILYKITYKLGKPDKCTVLCGTEMVSVGWESLIVLHRSSNPNVPLIKDLTE